MDVLAYRIRRHEEKVRDICKTNYPGFPMALRALLKKNRLSFMDLIREIDRCPSSIWSLRYKNPKISVKFLRDLCFFFSITDTDLANLTLNPAYIDQIAPRRHDMEMNPAPPDLYNVYTTVTGKIRFVKKRDGDFFLGNGKIKKNWKEPGAYVFTEKESSRFVKMSNKTFKLSRMLIVKKRLAFDPV